MPTPRTWTVGDEVTAALLNGMAQQIFTANSYTPVLTASTTNPTGYTAVGQWLEIGNFVWYWFNITLGSSVGSGYYMVSTPTTPITQIQNVGFTPCGPGVVSSSGFNAAQGQWNIYAGAKMILRVPTSLTVIANVTNTTPLTLVSGSAIAGSVMYQSTT